VLEGLAAIVLALVVAWIGLIAFLLVARRSVPRAGELLRLLPDTVRLLRRLAMDPEVPRAARLRLWLLLAYLACPVDLVPDFVPVLGYVDDAIIAAAVLRSVVRAAGMPALRRQWPGTADGLQALLRAAGIAA
jgi:uncharacterized membrane protein YkvA (DUF1232 family)